MILLDWMLYHTSYRKKNRGSCPRHQRFLEVVDEEYAVCRHTRIGLASSLAALGRSPGSASMKPKLSKAKLSEP
jgi:hypothetical protein